MWSALTVIEDCVRAAIWGDATHSPTQLGQRQFHRGRPPPAADPNTRTRTVNERFWCRLARGDVESHFHVEGDLSDLGLGPGHLRLPSSEVDATIAPPGETLQAPKDCLLNPADASAARSEKSLPVGACAGEIDDPYNDEALLSAFEGRD